MAQTEEKYVRLESDELFDIELTRLFGVVWPVVGYPQTRFVINRNDGYDSGFNLSLHDARELRDALDEMLEDITDRRH
jgi:hypothetical protein